MRYIIFHSGMENDFELVSFPDGSKFEIMVYGLDPSGDKLYQGSSQLGFPFFAVGIKFPRNHFLAMYARDGSSIRIDIKKPKRLEKSAKEFLEDLLSRFWVSSGRYRLLKSCS